ncbi:MAG: DUF4912 domain-containing protein [Thermodesulfovibrionales bacterium]
MKKATKSATRKETKTKPVAGTAVNPKAGQKIKSSGDAKAKKVAKAKEVPASVAKPKVKAGIKTKTETAAKPKVRLKAEAKTPAKAKPVVKKKEAAKATPKKVAAAVKPKAKIEKKPLKVAAPKKATQKAVLKSRVKKVVSPGKKTLGIQQKKAAPAKKAVPAATKKTVAALPKKVLNKAPNTAIEQAPKKVTLQAAAPAKKPKETTIKVPVKSISKPRMFTAQSAKLPLKKKVPVKTTPRLIKTEPDAKTLIGGKSGLRPAAETEARKPEEKPAKKAVRTPSKLMPVRAEKLPATKAPGTGAKMGTKVSATEVSKEPAGKKQGQQVAATAAPLKKPRIVRPAVPAVAEETEEELLSVAEIEAGEGRVIKPRLKIFLPREETRNEIINENIDEKKDKPGMGRESLPEKYGESEFFMIVIDPNLIFLDWEIIPEDLPAEGLSLCVRIFDVTGITFDGTNAHGFIDIDLEGLAGSGYCEIGMQGREIVAEIGFIDAHGVFIALMKSAKTSVPPLLQYDELGIVRKMQEAGLPVGY